MSKGGSSQRWLSRQRKDPYVSQARAQGYRSRAVYKLQELDRRYRVFRRGMGVLDLGAVPGGWSQYAAHRLAGQGRIVAVDLLPMEPLAGVEFIQGDFREDALVEQIRAHLGQDGLDLVLSDMAPNLSGNPAVDQPRAIYLAELARDLAFEWLRPGGGMILKLFHGAGYDEFVRGCRAQFTKVVINKPPASRSRSREVYLFAQGQRSRQSGRTPEP